VSICPTAALLPKKYLISTKATKQATGFVFLVAQAEMCHLHNEGAHTNKRTNAQALQHAKTNTKKKKNSTSMSDLSTPHQHSCVTSQPPRVR
jgi:hypothetical protein